MTTLAVTRRFDLTDEQWARLEPLLPAGNRPDRPLLWTKGVYRGLSESASVTSPRVV